MQSISETKTEKTTHACIQLKTQKAEQHAEGTAAWRPEKEQKIMKGASGHKSTTHTPMTRHAHVAHEIDD